VLLRRAHDAKLGVAVWTDLVSEQPRPPLPDNPEPTLDQLEPIGAPVQPVHVEPAPVTPPATPPMIIRATTPKPTEVTAPPMPQPQLDIESDDLPVVVPISPAPQQAPQRSSGMTSDEVDLAAGDVIVHPKFRRCVVQRIEGNNEYVQVRLRNGRVVRLSLDIIELTPQGTENGQRVFAARIS
jgi:hypothetical protein